MGITFNYFEDKITVLKYPWRWTARGLEKLLRARYYLILGVNIRTSKLKQDIKILFNPYF